MGRACRDELRRCPASLSEENGDGSCGPKLRLVSSCLPTSPGYAPPDAEEPFTSPPELTHSTPPQLFAYGGAYDPAQTNRERLTHGIHDNMDETTAWRTYCRLTTLVVMAVCFSREVKSTEPQQPADVVAVRGRRWSHDRVVCLSGMSGASSVAACSLCGPGSYSNASGPPCTPDQREE